MRRATSFSVLCVLALASACSSGGGDDGNVNGASSGDPDSPGASSGASSGDPNDPNNPNNPSDPNNPNNPGEPPPIPYVHFDINHVVSTGQSNSVAHEGRPVLSTSQPYANLMFDVGVMTSGVCEAEGCRTYQKPTSFAPLVEGDTFWYPVETMSSGLANEATKLATTKFGKAKHDILVSLAGRNGLTYWCLRKGGCNFIDPTYVNAYAESLMQVDDAMAIAKAQNKSYVVRAVTTVHGESDDYAYATGSQEFPLDGSDGTPGAVKSYADGLIEWQYDYETAIKAKTGQTIDIPLLVSQHSGWNDIPTSAVAMMQYEAHVRSKGKVVLVTAGYPLEYHSDCRHYSNNGERMLGEYFAKAYTRIVVEGKPWEPVHPKTATIAGAVITAQFHVPKPPLVFDTTRITDPGNYGFDVADAAGNPLPIASVALTGPDTVTITLQSAPNGKPHLRYAYSHPAHTCPGRTAGARGNLRDSDDTPSQNGYELFNWAVHFDVPVQ